MADEVDISTERQEAFLSAKAAEVRRAAAMIPVGEPGECEMCGEDSPRLVNGCCAKCRDKYKLP